MLLTLLLLGPNFLISHFCCANDPGGAEYGTARLGVIVRASVLSMGIQLNATDLDVAMVKDVAIQCRERRPMTVVLVPWLANEFAMFATDVVLKLFVPSWAFSWCALFHYVWDL